MKDLEQFGETMAKIMNCYQTGKDFNFTKQDAIAIMKAGQTVKDASEKKSNDDFPEFLDTDSTGENLPENSPVQSLQKMIVGEPKPLLAQSVERVKPLVTFIKAKTLELLAENVNKFNNQDSIQILSASPFQIVGSDFVKEIVYFDYETSL